MRHPDRALWYISALLAIALSLVLAGGIFFLTVAGPSFIWGEGVLIVWPYLGIPLGAILALISLPVCLRHLPDVIYRLCRGRSV